jgi:hypothetical protein
VSLASGKRPFREYIAETRSRLERRREGVRRAFAKSPAVIITEGTHTELVMVGKDPSSPDEWRVTTFMPDGPWGHSTYATRDEAVAAVADRSGKGLVTPADDDDVQEWTSTPEFVHGSKVVAFVQAANALRYWAAQQRDSDLNDRTWKLIHRAEAMEDVEEATAVVEAELRKVAPKENKRVSQAWVTTALADAYETMSARVKPAWLPKLSDVHAGRGGKLVGTMKQYGCGNYGCVFPTSDPNVVLKITTDDTESEFAAALSHDLEAPITVDYHTVMRLPVRRAGKAVFLLWRESAEAVGEIQRELGRTAFDLIETQHAAAQDVLHLILDQAPMSATAGALAAWIDTCDQIADQDAVPEIQALGRGMAHVFHTQRIFFGDVHAGNLGRVTRQDGPRWVITDPGNVIVFGGKE